MSTALQEPPVAAQDRAMQTPPLAPAGPAAKANPPHPWVGRSVHYWRTTNQTTGEISAVPAILIQPARVTEGWDLNTLGRTVQFRQSVKFSDAPKAGCWTWPPQAESDAPESKPKGRKSN